MALSQIQFTYDEPQDRVLWRVSTTEGDEFRLSLTRRFTRRFWGLLVKLLEADPPVRQQLDSDTKRTVLGIRHEGFAQQGNFSVPYEEREYRRPLGEEPMLVARAEGKVREDGSYLLRVHPLQGQGVDIVLDTKLLHLIARSLGQVVARTDWDITLELFDPAKEAVPKPGADTQPGKLN